MKTQERNGGNKVLRLIKPKPYQLPYQSIGKPDELWPTETSATIPWPITERRKNELQHKYDRCVHIFFFNELYNTTPSHACLMQFMNVMHNPNS